MTRASGISVPLFAIPTTRSWGIGEFYDLVDFARWAGDAGQSVVQILPIMEMPAAERSPYSALTSFALDPIYITVPRVPDYPGSGHLPPALQAELRQLRAASAIPYARVRALKERCLQLAWSRFALTEVPRRTERVLAFESFCARESWWLDDYAVFRALLDVQEQRAWWEWPPKLKQATPEELAHLQARATFSYSVGYRKYLQWIAAEQWQEARRLAAPRRVFGDLPFMISGNSADVWLHQDEFRLDATVGAPPDAFATDGQDWGLPPWRAPVMRERGYRWFRARARRHADLFEGFRIDHLVGLYRTWTRPIDKSQAAHFEPAEPPEQQALGEDLVAIFKAAGAQVIAEDLGSVPDFVRTSITALGVPGFKVLQWERHWDEPGQPPIDPRTFPALSVATTGTHDIEPLAATLSDEEVRVAVETLLAAGSFLSLIPIQDVFAWSDRINTPSVVDEINWTWRVPRPVDTWAEWPEASERQTWLAEATRAARR